MILLSTRKVGDWSGIEIIVIVIVTDVFEFGNQFWDHGYQCHLMERGSRENNLNPFQYLIGLQHGCRSCAL